MRTREALDTGAGKIATSCSFCLLMLTSSASRDEPQRKVFDIAELVADSLAEKHGGVKRADAQPAITEH